MGPGLTPELSMIKETFSYESPNHGSNRFFRDIPQSSAKSVSTDAEKYTDYDFYNAQMTLIKPSKLQSGSANAENQRKWEELHARRRQLKQDILQEKLRLKIGDFQNSVTDQILNILERDSKIDLAKIDEDELRMSLFDGYRQMVESQIKLESSGSRVGPPKNGELQSKLRFIASKLVPHVRQFMKTELKKNSNVEQIAEKLKNSMSVVHFYKRKRKNSHQKGSVVIKNRLKLGVSPLPSEIDSVISNRLRGARSEPDNNLNPFSGFNSVQNYSRNSMPYASTAKTGPSQRLSQRMSRD